MMNRVILVGRITKDPELKTTQSGVSVVTFTLAVNRSFTDASGERQADFVQCVVWRKQAENLSKYVSKGALLGVEGRIQTRNYESETGTRYVTEVVCDSVTFLESKGENQQSKSDFEDKFNSDDDDFYESSKTLVSKEDLPF